jgi:hypothetical protein
MLKILHPPLDLFQRYLRREPEQFDQGRGTEGSRERGV